MEYINTISIKRQRIATSHIPKSVKRKEGERVSEGGGKVTEDKVKDTELKQSIKAAKATTLRE